MTEPDPQRPVPGPPRSSTPDPDRSPEPARPGAPGAPAGVPAENPFADLEQRPVAEHVAVYEAEHGRLQRELGTIDQL